MSITSTLNTPQPTQAVNFPFLGTHLHTDKQTIVYWLVLQDGSGVVVDKTGRKIPVTPPVTPPVPATGSITLSDATVQVVTDGQTISLPFGISIVSFTSMTSWTMDVVYNGVAFNGIAATTSSLTPTNTGVMAVTFHAPVVPPATPVYYTPSTTSFPIGYQEPNVMSRYSVIPYIGSITLATNTTAI